MPSESPAFAGDPIHDCKLSDRQAWNRSPDLRVRLTRNTNLSARSWRNGQGRRPPSALSRFTGLPNRPAWPQAHHRRARISTAGWCRRPRWRSICASAWPTGSACSGCRCRARSAVNSVLPGMTLAQALFTTTCDWRVSRPRLDVHAVLRAARDFGGDLGRLARTRRPAQGGRRGRRSAGAAAC